MPGRSGTARLAESDDIGRVVFWHGVSVEA
jgi:hypothetical protein